MADTTYRVTVLIEGPDSGGREVRTAIEMPKAEVRFTSETIESDDPFDALANLNTHFVVSLHCHSEPGRTAYDAYNNPGADVLARILNSWR